MTKVQEVVEAITRNIPKGSDDDILVIPIIVPLDHFWAMPFHTILSRNVRNIHITVNLVAKERRDENE